MGFFTRESPVEKEGRRLLREEQRFLQKRLEKNPSHFQKKLEEKVPPKLQSALDTAFSKAFTLIFEKGTGLVEKTYSRQKLEQEYQVRQYTLKIKQDSKSLRSFSKTVRSTSAKNTLLSGASGIGMGTLGIGLPDIPIFTGMLLKNLYEIALHFGYGYETKEERYFILLLIQGAVSNGETFLETDQKLSQFIRSGKLPDGYEEKNQMAKTAEALSKELLYLKFLQGVPLVGAVGGAYDAVYMKQIAVYAGIKYRRRHLAEEGSLPWA